MGGDVCRDFFCFFLRCGFLIFVIVSVGVIILNEYVIFFWFCLKGFFLMKDFIVSVNIKILRILYLMKIFHIDE